ncbi:unnamed protein product, partial [Amoebophrya sp. A120]|eukprot:GSA120T00026407001.1
MLMNAFAYPAVTSISVVTFPFFTLAAKKEISAAFSSKIKQRLDLPKNTSNAVLFHTTGLAPPIDYMLVDALMVFFKGAAQQLWSLHLSSDNIPSFRPAVGLVAAAGPLPPTPAPLCSSSSSNSSNAVSLPTPPRNDVAVGESAPSSSSSSKRPPAPQVSSSSSSSSLLLSSLPQAGMSSSSSSSHHLSVPPAADRSGSN